mmetsp:Transcript_28184/g.51523  ORF Transcript_28184/g.51523 Transcript_28184/m.51523 type:complete len:487 (+) Transcript_28184:123-1583(+)|eukprot:CAMPEP_0196134938 /NCGR_PEP_ID=MMETSP0910-20130528/3733_1 /TAXON_ID=49265 /ORGANISM="Thalassiosira rotula, Strain GSO102" /LENGTH=486 /DNA_ID=CAMNT_0041394993 /DNA_START=27 /DNA_END=1487 /DNA_ORIENTATION=+
MMLVHRSTVLAALLALSGTNCNAFSSSTHQNQNNNHRITTTTQLHSTIPAPGSVTSSLTPPSSIDSSSTSDLFDTRVQKTYGRYPITFVSGSGSTLTDENGKTYLDFVSGIATCALGHNNPSLTKAVCDQMGQLHHVSNLYYTPGQGLLAAWLCENSCADKAFFCNSGAESNEAAIKLARKHANDRGITDPVIITAEQSFHGRTLATVTATAQPKYHKGFTYGGEMVRGFKYTPYNDLDALEKLVEEINVTPEEDAKAGRKRGVAAIMLEPLQGEGGIVPGKREYFELARKLCDDNGALLICDEVQVGMGRSGSLWGHEQLGVEPDVFTSAKALGGGVPIGAMMARGEAASVFGPGDHASTYGGNPLACAAGLAVAEYLSEHDVLANVQARGEQLMAGLADIATRYPTVLGEARGWGLLRGVPIKEEAGCTAAELVGDAMAEGLLLVAAGPTVVRFVPPLVVTEEEVTEAMARFEKVIAKRVESSS